MKISLLSLNLIEIYNEPPMSVSRENRISTQKAFKLYNQHIELIFPTIISFL